MNSDSHSSEKGGSDSSQSYTNTIINEKDFEHYNTNNNSLFIENQSLKQQLERALKFSKEIDKINSKNTELFDQVQNSNLMIASLQHKIQISQQKNQDLEAQSQEKNILYQKLSKQVNELEKSLNNSILKVEQHENTIKQLNEQILLVSNEKSNFIKSFNQLFTSNLTSLTQIFNFIETFKAASEKEQSSTIIQKEKIIDEIKGKYNKIQEENEKMKSEYSGLKKKNSTISKQLKAKISQYENVKQELSDLKVTFEEQSQRLLTLSKNNEIGKDQAQKLQSMINQIQNDRREEIGRFQQMIEIKEKRIHELQEKLTNPPHEEDNEYMKIIQELSSIRAERDDIQQKLKSQQEINQKLKDKFNSSYKRLQLYQREKEILEKKFSEITQVQKQSQINENKFKTQLFDLVEQNRTLEQENAHLKTQLKAAMASHVESESAFNQKEQDILRLQTALNKIEPILQNQESEIASLSNERKKFVNIIQMQTKILSLYELQTQSLNQKIIEISRNLKTKSMEFSFFRTIESCLLPELKADSRNKINSILYSQNINNQNKIEIICKEIISNLNNKEKLLFKTSMISEITGKKFTKESFIDFISSQMNTHLNSEKSLFQGSYENRTATLKNLIDEKISMQQLIDLFSAQVIINILSDKEINELKDKLNSASLVEDEFRSYFGDKPVSQVSEKITNLKQKVKKLKKSLTNNSYSKDLEMECQQQKEKISKLEESLKTVVNDASVLQSQLEIKTEQCKALQNNYEKTQKESSNIYSKHMDELNKYETSLEKRNNDIKILTSKLSKCSIECEEKTKALQKINNDLINSNALKEEKFHNALLNLKEQNSKLQEKLNENEQTKKVEIIKLAKIQNELKLKLNEAIKVLKSQLEENKVLSDKLNQSLVLNESNSKKFQDDINKITLAKKALEMQLQSSGEQSKREIEVLNSQFNFTMLATKTKYQEEINSLKTRIISDRNNMILTILEEFDELNNLDIDDLNEVDFKLKIKEIARKYKSLKVHSL